METLGRGAGTRQDVMIGGCSLIEDPFTIQASNGQDKANISRSAHRDADADGNADAGDEALSSNSLTPDVISWISGFVITSEY